MQKVRLLKLAKFLRENVKDKKFSLSSWAEGKSKANECGTSACACGWATIAFPRSGLKLRWSEWSDAAELTYKMSDGTVLRSLSAAEHFFGLTYDQAIYLFLAENYPTNKRGRISVANRIEKFVSDGKHTLIKD